MPKTRILFDFSSLSEQNIQTGIQRVARRLYEELHILSNEAEANFEVVPVTYKSSGILQGFFQLPLLPLIRQLQNQLPFTTSPWKYLPIPKAIPHPLKHQIHPKGENQSSA